MAGVMKTYIIEEVAVYYVQAKSTSQAERKFLKAIALTDQSIHCEVPERDVYPDPENRLTLKKEG